MINPHERVDDLQCGVDGKNFHIIQDPDNFCFGIDAVCLANFAAGGTGLLGGTGPSGGGGGVRIKKGDKVLDLCTGTGIVPILLCAKTNAGHITGLEIQPQMAEMAERSVEMNGLCERIQIDCGDLKDGASIYPANHFDVITVNPPYIAFNGGVLNENKNKAIARHEIACNLTDIVALSSRLLKTGGKLFMVHRPNRLVDVLCTLRGVRLEPKVLQFVQSGLNEPSLVLIEAVDHGNSGIKVLQNIDPGTVTTWGYYPRT